MHKFQICICLYIELVIELVFLYLFYYLFVYLIYIFQSDLPNTH